MAADPVQELPDLVCILIYTTWLSWVSQSEIDFVFFVFCHFYRFEMQCNVCSIYIDFQNPTEVVCQISQRRVSLVIQLFQWLSAHAIAHSVIIITRFPALLIKYIAGSNISQYYTNISIMHLSIINFWLSWPMNKSAHPSIYPYLLHLFLLLCVFAVKWNYQKYKT